MVPLNEKEKNKLKAPSLLIHRLNQIYIYITLEFIVVKSCNMRQGLSNFMLTALMRKTGYTQQFSHAHYHLQQSFHQLMKNSSFLSLPSPWKSAPHPAWFSEIILDFSLCKRNQAIFVYYSWLSFLSSKFLHVVPYHGTPFLLKCV